MEPLHFHLVMDTIDRLPQTGDKGIYLKQQLDNRLIEHKEYIDENGQDLPAGRNWKWKNEALNCPIILKKAANLWINTVTITVRYTTALTINMSLTGNGRTQTGVSGSACS